MKMINVNGMAQTYAAPSILAIITGVGIVSALIGDGLYDGLSWLMLSLPLLMIYSVVLHGSVVWPLRHANLRCCLIGFSVGLAALVTALAILVALLGLAAVSVHLAA